MSYGRGGRESETMLASSEDTHARKMVLHDWLIALALIFGIAGTVMGIVALCIKQNASGAAIPTSCTTSKVAVQGVCDNAGVSPTIGLKVCKAGTYTSIEVPAFNCDATVNSSNISPAPLFIKLAGSLNPASNFGALNVPSFFTHVAHGSGASFNDPVIAEKTSFCVNGTGFDSKAYILIDPLSNTSYLTMGWAGAGPAGTTIATNIGYGLCDGFVMGPYTATTGAPAQAMSMAMVAGAVALALM